MVSGIPELKNSLIFWVLRKNGAETAAILLRESITDSLKKKLTNYAFNNGLIDINKFNMLIRQLYKFRNSIVHAKERHIQDTTIPNPFEENQIVYRWINIVDELSRRCIKKFNEL